MLLVPGCGPFTSISDLADCGLVKRLPSNLQAHGKTITVKAARHLNGRQPRKVEDGCVDGKVRLRRGYRSGPTLRSLRQTRGIDVMASNSYSLPLVWMPLGVVRSRDTFCEFPGSWPSTCVGSQDQLFRGNGPHLPPHKQDLYDLSLLSTRRCWLGQGREVSTDNLPLPPHFGKDQRGAPIQCGDLAIPGLPRKNIIGIHNTQIVVKDTA